MLGDYWVPSREKLVTEAKANMITFALIKGYDVVVDNMNLNPKEDAWIRTLCENIEKDTGIHVNIEYKDFWTPVEECIRRDAARPNPIGEKIIKETWRRYRNFIISSDIKEMLKNKAEHVDGGRPVILVDMDATLCLNTSGRPFYGENSANGMLEDTPVEEICRLVRQMGEHCLVFIVTGREGTAEVVDATKEWLKKNEIPSDAMFFRPVGDYSPGPDCKRRIYEENIKGKYNVQFVLDDSSKCVKMWRTGTYSMSRTYKEHHPTAHNPKNRIPTPYLDKEGKVERRRKRRAYGSQGWKGWGGEIYFKKYGEIMMDVVDKKKARREAKKHIENELQDQL